MRLGSAAAERSGDGFEGGATTMGLAERAKAVSSPLPGFCHRTPRRWRVVMVPDQRATIQPRSAKGHEGRAFITQETGGADAMIG
jgi:hypothetical protein